MSGALASIQYICEVAQYLGSKNNWDIKELPLPRKRLDLRVGRMTT